MAGEVAATARIAGDQGAGALDTAPAYEIPADMEPTTSTALLGLQADDADGRATSGGAASTSGVATSDMRAGVPSTTHAGAKAPDAPDASEHAARRDPNFGAGATIGLKNALLLTSAHTRKTLAVRAALEATARSMAAPVGAAEDGIAGKGPGARHSITNKKTLQYALSCVRQSSELQSASHSVANGGGDDIAAAAVAGDAGAADYALAQHIADVLTEEGSNQRTAENTVLPVGGASTSGAVGSGVAQLGSSSMPRKRVFCAGDGIVLKTGSCRRNITQFSTHFLEPDPRLWEFSQNHKHHTVVTVYSGESVVNA